MPPPLEKTTNNGRLSFIPWNTGALWKEVNESIRHLVLHRDRELKKAGAIARSILKEMKGVFPEMEELCTDTCPLCPDPCCKAAKLWFDFKDLIFLHLNGIAIPESQPMHHYNEICRYLGKRGCVLKRETRPWICTMYLCPSQTARLRRKGRMLYTRFDGKLSDIRDRRNELEDEFILSITGPSGE